MHLTLSMLPLVDEAVRASAVSGFESLKTELQNLMKDFTLQFEGVGCFENLDKVEKMQEKGKSFVPRVLFLKVKQDEHYEKLERLANSLIRKMIEENVS